MILPTTNDSQGLIRVHKTHDEVNTYGHLIRHLTTDKDARKLTILLIINLVCAVLEVIYGLISNSIGLLSDSAHMLFDSTALAVGIYASYKATLPANSKFSYGFDRFQTLSGLINGIFLIFIGFYIFIESLERIYNPPVIQSRKMIVVAVIGLIVNVVGVTFFHEHAHFGEEHDHGHGCSHSHGHKHKKEEKSHKHSHKAHDKCTGDHSHHSHSHGNSHSHSHHHHDHSDNVSSIHQIESSNSVPSTLNSIKEDEHHHHGHSHGHTHHAGCNHGHNSQQPDHHHQHNCNHEEKSHAHSHSHEHKHEHKHKHDHSHEEHEHLHDHDDHHDHDHDHDHEHDHGHDHHHNENLYGVFLHILADLLGSVGVITSSILIMLFDWYIADAICSAITSLLILASVVPLIKSSIMVFLQTYPAKYKDSYHKALAEISQHPAVIEFRDAHLWAYTQSKLVCSVVLIVKQNTTDTTKIVEFARKKLKVIKKIEYMTIDCRVEGQM